MKPPRLAKRLRRFRRRLRRRLRHLVRYPLEGGLALLLFRLFARLGIDRASALGGAVGRAIGPLLPASRGARRRLRRAMPELDEPQAAQVIRGVWDNLGRVIAEFPHVAAIDPLADTDRFTIDGLEHVHRLRDDGLPGIFFGAHVGNWELLPIIAARCGMPVTAIYRHANNPISERLFLQARGFPGVELVRKAPDNGPLLMKRLREGRHLALLVDQKLSQGMPVPFFGRDAMTAPAVAVMALRFRCPLVPAHAVRLDGARFRVVIEPPLDLPDSGHVREDVRVLLTRINAVVEGWVREHPDQWLWLHRRWPED